MSKILPAVKLDNSGTGPLQVPGFFGLPIDFTLPPEDRFAHGVHDYQQTPAVTAREMAMTGAMCHIIDKPGWHRDVFDEAVVASWKSEAQHREAQHWHKLVSDESWNWCVAELRDKAVEYEKDRLVRVIDTGSCACVSDELLPLSLTTALQQELHPEGERPPPNGGNSLSVDACLYPLVHGETLVRDRGGTVKLEHFSSSHLPPTEEGKRKGKKSQTEKSAILGFAFEGEEDGEGDSWIHGSLGWGDMPNLRGFSRTYQRLPCEVEFVGDSGTDVKITSYINNLHPSKKSVYQVLEKIISASIAPWNACLIRGAANDSGERQRGRIPLRIVTYGAIWKVDPATNESRSARYKWEHPQPGTSFSYADWKAGRNIDKAVVKMVAQPLFSDEVCSGPTHTRYKVNLEQSYRENGLQVIIQIESIHLPEYGQRCSAHDWHLNGLQNEHVVAKSIYVYDASNVSAKIRFRQETAMDNYVYRYEAGGNPDWCQTDDESEFQIRNQSSWTEIGALESLYGFKSEDALNASFHSTVECFQEIGTVELRKGRLVTFPNTIESRMEVELLPDVTRGHLRFVTVWLVDPNYRICSTRNVPPQQHGWWADKVPDVLRETELPQEMIDLIADEVRWSMSESQAQFHRKRMIREFNMLYERRHREIGRYFF